MPCRFMLAGLRALDADLQRRGSHLILRYGEPLKVLTGLKQEVEALIAKALRSLELAE